ncbi:MAG: AAA family ATPase, partial [Bacteroidota bacterium]
MQTRRYSLIPINSHFFAVSYGFAEGALTLLSDFKNEIKLETTIQEWVSNIIGSNAELSSLNYENIKGRLNQILQSIVFEPIIPQDLDLLLSCATHQNIIPLFFEVKVVPIAPEGIRQVLREELGKATEYSDVSNIPVNVLLNNFEHASTYLRNYNNQLEGLDSSYIDRPQVNEVLQWIISPLRFSDKKGESDLPIALLSGNAGVGKTVIMAQLLHALEQKGIPTLGLKADKIYIKNINQLGEKLDLGDNVVKVIQAIRQTRDKIVILVDQLDALSVSVSINTEYLDTFNRLIRKLIELEGVRVIVSCRVYDLNYDNELRFYKNQKIFNVGLLDKDQVLKVLTRLNISAEQVQPSLIELLRTVHHLNVFCKVYRSGISIHEIRSLNDLYNSLWKDKVLLVPLGSNVTSEKCRELLFEVSDRMSRDQQILVQAEQYHDRFIYELDYLKSNHILVESDGELQFFHQTLYDYVFARRFIESNRTVRDYIFENNQALHIRSALRMIVNFLKERDPQKYIRVCYEILFQGNLWHRLIGKQYRKHIRLLVIESLGNSKEIDRGEKEIGLKLISDPLLKRPFLDSIDSRNWIQFCLDHNILEDLVARQQRIKGFWPGSTSILPKSEKVAEDDINLCYRFLIKHINRERDLILKFLHDSAPFEHKGRLLARLLYYLETWDETSCELFNRFKEDIYPDKHSLYGILDKASSYDINWVIGHYSTIVFKKIDEYNNPLDKPDFSYEDERLFTRLFQINAERTFEFCRDIVKTLSLKTKVDYDGQIIWSDYVFNMFDYEDHRNSHDTYGILHLLIDETRKLSEAKSHVFQKFIDDHIDSDSETFLMLLLNGLASNPQAYSAEFYKMTFILRRKDFFESEGKLQYLWRKILKKLYDSFTVSEQESLINLILSLKFARELRVFNDGNRKYHYLTQYGSTRYHYLQALPAAAIESSVILKRLCQELGRKFPKSSDYRRPRTGGGIVGPPLEKNAYEKMDLANWEHSFRKYDSDYRPDFWTLKGSKLEHGRSFEVEVQKRPSYFFPLVEKIIDDSSIERSYAIHGMQGLKSARFNPLEFRRLLKKLIATDLDETNTLYSIWLTDLLFDTQTINWDIIQYLCDKAINHPDPETEKRDNDALMDGINTVRGAAASRLPYLTSTDHKEHIFATVYKVTEDQV